MWRRTAWLVSMWALLVFGVLVWSTRAIAVAPDGWAAVEALATAADKGRAQVAELVASDRDRYLPALVAAVEHRHSGRIQSGNRRVDRRRLNDGPRMKVLAEALAAQGEAALPELLPRLMHGVAQSRLQETIELWSPAVIESVTSRLSSEDPAQRRGAEQALIWLAARPAHGQAVITALLARPAAKTKNLEARLPALGWPTHLDRGQRPPVPEPVDQSFLVGLIGHERPQIARWAINSLAGLGQTAKPAAPALRQWLAPRLAAWNGETTKSAPWQQNEPTNAGYRLFVPRSESAPWRMFSASEGDLVHDAMVALYRVDPNSPETLQAIRQTAGVVRNPLYADLWLTRLGLAKDTQAVELLIEELENPDPVPRQTAAVGLGRIGAAAAEAKVPLQRAIDASRAGRRAFHHDRHRRRWSPDFTAPPPANDEEALAAIAQARSTTFRPDEELKFRQAAEAALRSLGGQAVDFELWVDASADWSGDAIPRWLLNREPPEFTWERATRQLAHWSVETRRRAILKVLDVSPDRTTAAEALAQQLIAPGIKTDAWFRQTLVDTLGGLGSDAKAALPRLLEIVASPKEDEFVRTQAVDALVRIAPGDPGVFSVFVQVLEGSSQKAPLGLFTRVAEKLAEMPAGREKAKKALDSLLQDQSAMNRHVGTYARGQLAKVELPAEAPELHARLRQWGNLSPVERTALLVGLTEIVQRARAEAELYDFAKPLPRTAPPVAWLPDLLAACQLSANVHEKREVLLLMEKIGAESTPDVVRVILDVEMHSLLPSLHGTDTSSLPLLLEARKKQPLHWTRERDLLLGIARYGADARPVAEALLPSLDPERLRASDMPVDQFNAALAVLAAAGPETPGVYRALFKLTDYPWPSYQADNLVGVQTASRFTRDNMSEVVRVLAKLGPSVEGSHERTQLLALFYKQLHEEQAMTVALAIDDIQRFAGKLTDQERRQLVEPLLHVLVEDLRPDGSDGGIYDWFSTRASAAKVLSDLGQAASGALPTLDAMAAEDPLVLRYTPGTYGSGRYQVLAQEARAAAEKIRQAGAESK